MGPRRGDRALRDRACAGGQRRVRRVRRRRRLSSPRALVGGRLDVAQRGRSGAPRLLATHAGVGLGAPVLRSLAPARAARAGHLRLLVRGGRLLPLGGAASPERGGMGGGRGRRADGRWPRAGASHAGLPLGRRLADGGASESRRDRKSTRLNSSHPSISYAVFCLKKKNDIYTS